MAEEYIEQYKILHEKDADFGTSSPSLYKEVRKIIKKVKPHTILDYGCGKGLLSDKIEKELKIKCYKYDIAIPEYSKLPEDKIDMIICTDVLEHIPLEYLPEVLEKISSISQNAFFNISCRKAGQILPNGENAHCTIYPPRWWQHTLSQYFGKVDELLCKDLTAASFFTHPSNVFTKCRSLFKKVKTHDGRRNIYIFGIKVFSYKKPVG